MKQLIYLLLVSFSATGYSQEYSRKKIDYKNLPADTTSVCNPAILSTLEKAYAAIDANNSTEAVNMAKKTFEMNSACPDIFDIYSYALFRNGQWLEGVDIIEKGIEKFGSVPELIKRRALMSAEMASLGTGQKNIDGNGVYKANGLPYEEKQFKTENYKSALLDLEYLANLYENPEDIYFIGMINQSLGNYTASNSWFEKLTGDEEYKFEALFNIADNYAAQKKYTEAEKGITNLLKELPREGQLYDKLAEIKELTGDSANAKQLKQQAIFYKNVPAFLDMAYSQEAYDMLAFFGTNKNTAKAKIEKLESIYAQKNTQKTAELSILILKLHANHGNGVEEKATDILAAIGKPTLPMVHNLFQSNVSTCTITNLAYVMATVKDTSSWKYMAEYLAYIPKMPSTMIPPAVPEMMMKYDEDRAIKEILRVVQPLLNADESGNAFGGMGNYVFYMPLEKVPLAKIKKMAAALNYTKEQLKALEEEIKE